MQKNNFQYKWWALIGLSTLAFTAFLDGTIITTAVPYIQQTFHASIIKLQWVSTIFVMVLSMMMIVSGRIGDIYGRRKIFYFSFVVFAIAAIGAATAISINWLIFFRGLQGFAGAIIFTLGVALLPQVFPEEQHATAIGFYTAVTGCGLALGPFIGGALIAVLDWRWVFWINIPIILIGFALCSFSVKESEKHHVDIDWPGFIFLALGIACLISGIVHGQQYAWSAWSTCVLLGVAVLSFIILFIIELKVEHPLIDVGIFTNKQALLAALMCVVAGTVSMVFMFFNSLYLKVIRDETAFVIGLMLFSVPVVQVVFSFFLGRMTKRFGILNLLVVAIGVSAIAAFGHLFFNANTTIMFVLVIYFLLGFAWAMGNAGSATAIIQSMPTERIGSSIGTVYTLWNMMASIFLAISAVIFHAREFSVMKAKLLSSGLHLSSQAHQKISGMLTDPTHASQVLKQFPIGQSHELLSLFNQSFLSGFHSVALLMGVLYVVIFVIALIRFAL